MERSIGQLAFESYRRYRQGKNHDGSETPEWKDLGEDIQDAWQMAAEAVKRQAITKIQLM